MLTKESACIAESTSRSSLEMFRQSPLSPMRSRCSRDAAASCAGMLNSPQPCSKRCQCIGRSSCTSKVAYLVLIQGCGIACRSMQARQRTAQTFAGYYATAHGLAQLRKTGRGPANDCARTCESRCSRCTRFSASKRPAAPDRIR